MDKRLVNFVLVSILLFIVYMEFLKLIQPPADPQDLPPAAELIDEQPPAGHVDPANVAADANGVLAETEFPTEVEVVPRETIAVQRFTVGSVDPDSGLPMLITFINQGAAVERVELSHPRYRDLTDNTAYIGHLALSPADTGGVTVGVVGGGTPAAKAGIEVGDVITKIGDVAVNSAEAAHRALLAFKYGQEVPITRARGGTSQTITVLSSRRPLEVIRPEPEFPREGQPQHPLSYLLGLHTIGPRSTQYDQDELPQIPSLKQENWQSNIAEVDGVTQVEFRFPLGPADLKPLGVDGSIEVVKRFWLRPGDGEQAAEDLHYHFNFEVELINRGAQPLDLGYRIDGATGLPLEGWWYSYKTRPGFWSWGAAGVRDIIWRQDGGNHGMYANAQINNAVEEAEEDPSKTPEMTIAESNFELEYLGTDAQYFNSSLLAPPLTDQGPRVMRMVQAMAVGSIDGLEPGESSGRSNRTDVTFRADVVAERVAAGSSLQHDYRIFAGPKHLDVLRKYGLEECVVYGWFKLFAQFMGVLLHGLYAVVRNYGIAIILLTVIVRACMFPIGRKMAMNAKKMQELSPEIKKIKEKYPNDTEKQAKAQQELFRKHNYNPLAGCLPMFIQIPIFIGLYRALSVDIELRQTPLIPGIEWCSNLAGPDMLLRWDSLIPIEFLTGYSGWLGPYLNILPVISAAVFIFHQKLFTPPPTDEQQEVQQKVMMLMPIMMCFLFFRMPAGLNLYFITSSLWALGERLLLPKDAKPGEASEPRSMAATLTGSGSTNGAGASATAVAAKKKRRKRNKK